jgi:glycine/D-amino acid oxidase-like deaminating enzyme
MWSVNTFTTLEQDEHSRPGWRQVGSLRIALNEARVEEFKRMKQVADLAGLEVTFLDSRSAQTKWPLMDFSQIQAALWCPTDGYLQPSDLTMAYAAHARRMGVTFQTGTAVQEIKVRRSKVTGIETDHGPIACNLVINAAGAHAYHIARSAGIELPIIPVRHEYFVTVPSEGMHPALPVIRIPDASLYLRAETGALLCGGWEPDSLHTDPRQYTLPESTPGIETDWDVLSMFAGQLSPFFPRVDELGVRSVFKGWPTFTPDGRFIIGESCRLGGFVMAGGCNAHGVSGSAGIGRHVVESLSENTRSDYVASLSPDRFTETRWDWETACQQAQHDYQTYYALDH